MSGSSICCVNQQSPINSIHFRMTRTVNEKTGRVDVNTGKLRSRVDVGLLYRTVLYSTDTGEA